MAVSHAAGRERIALLGTGPLLEGYRVAPVVSLFVLIVLLASYELKTNQEQLTVVAWSACVGGFTLFLFHGGRVADAFESLARRNVLPRRRYAAFVDRTGRDFSGPAVVVGAVLAPVVVLIGWWLNDPGFVAGSRKDKLPWTVPELIEVGASLPLASLVGIGLVRMSIIGRGIHRLGKRRKLHVYPYHPDGCGGLRPIGDLCLWNGIIIAFPAVALAVFVLAGVFGQLGGPHLVHVVLMLVVALAAVVAFGRPLLGIHAAMEAAALEQPVTFEAMEQITPSLHDGALRFLRQAGPGQPIDARIGWLNASALELEALARSYRVLAHPAVWPVDLGHVIKFLLVEALPIASTASAVASFLVEGQPPI